MNNNNMDYVDRVNNIVNTTDLSLNDVKGTTPSIIIGNIVKKFLNIFVENDCLDNDRPAIYPILNSPGIELEWEKDDIDYSIVFFDKNLVEFSFYYHDIDINKNYQYIVNKKDNTIDVKKSAEYIFNEYQKVKNMMINLIS